MTRKAIRSIILFVLLIILFLFSPITIEAKENCLGEGEIIKNKEDVCCKGYYAVKWGTQHFNGTVQRYSYCHKKRFANEYEGLIIFTIFIVFFTLALWIFIVHTILSIRLSKLKQDFNVLSGILMPFYLTNSIRRNQLQDHPSIRRIWFQKLIITWISTILFLIVIITLLIRA